MTVPSHPWASVVIPIKDERDNLTPLIEGLLKVMDSHEASRSRPFEIIFVDDGSSDGSSELLDRLAAQHPEVTTLHLDRNYGKTCALDAGFKRSAGELIIAIDGDLQQDSEDILKLLPLTTTYDVVCGWRVTREDGLVKMISSRVANWVRNFFTHDGIHDTGCPLKIFRRPCWNVSRYSKACIDFSQRLRSCMGSQSPKCRSGTTRAFTASQNMAWVTDYSNHSTI